jgi:hypothetical protein
MTRVVSSRCSCEGTALLAGISLVVRQERMMRHFYCPNALA